ncbi:hypothetical protein DL89DRAFT_284805 [Linderina pennispora]|uniref:Uncharacterized protein n=1 Tax=Linderina pennispora TaxID=61395 RepID=A0A1Y1W5E1_9FUNG|nr:uncharacterized protein DL89DRAFT_284805 [Linderina pennispora]ORX68737.1 hypothetical protein DL89DRAFT_284805 [Linderina pennispora]
MSLDVAVGTIKLGKAKVTTAGASGSYSRNVASTTPQIKMTTDALEDHAIGRSPKELSQPCTATCSGFAEGIVSWILIRMSASAAIRCGAPIYGVPAMTATATDKEGHIIPTPGQGILMIARESPTGDISPFLNISLRRQERQKIIASIKSWADAKHSQLGGKSDFTNTRVKCIESKVRQMIKNAQGEQSNKFWRNDPTIFSLCSSLATWRLTIVASGKNDPHVINQQLKKLGRTHGYAVPVVCQKWLAGHPRMLPAAWMLNSMIQCMQTGIVPGNRNLDNVISELVEYSHPVSPSRSIQTPGISTTLHTPFRFGQVGGEIPVPIQTMCTQFFHKKHLVSTGTR